MEITVHTGLLRSVVHPTGDGGSCVKKGKMAERTPPHHRTPGCGGVTAAVAAQTGRAGPIFCFRKVRKLDRRSPHSSSVQRRWSGCSDG